VYTEFARTPHAHKCHLWAW